MKKRYVVINNDLENPMLSQGFWEGITGKDLIRPNVGLELTNESKNALYITAGVLAVGAIITAIIVTNKK